MKRKLLLGLLVYAIVGIIAGGLQAANVPLGSQLWIGLAVVVGVTYPVARTYFKRTPGDFRQGILLGLVWFAEAVILDAIFIAIAFGSGQSAAIGELTRYYANWQFWLSVILMVLTAGLAGKYIHGGALVVSQAKPPMAPPKN